MNRERIAVILARVDEDVADLRLALEARGREDSRPTPQRGLGVLLMAPVVAPSEFELAKAQDKIRKRTLVKRRG